MNGKSYSYTKTFAKSELNPTKIDTFAFTMPGGRGYKKVRIYDLTSSDEVW